MAKDYFDAALKRFVEGVKWLVVDWPTSHEPPAQNDNMDSAQEWVRERDARAARERAAWNKRSAQAAANTIDDIWQGTPSAKIVAFYLRSIRNALWFILAAIVILALLSFIFAMANTPDPRPYYNPYRY